MPDNCALDELDLSLLHALQVAPRLSWNRLQDVLDVDASTLSRRWKRLQGEGIAWVFMHPPSNPWAQESVSFIEVACDAGKREEVAGVLEQDPAAWTVEFTTGKRDLFLTVGTRTLRDLDRYVQHRVSALPGVKATRTHIVRKTYRDGSLWRLNALTSTQLRALASSSEVPEAPHTERTPFELELLNALARDGRRSASSISAELGRSESTVARGIDRLLGSVKGHMRCDIAREYAGWGYAAVLMVTVPQSTVAALARGLAVMPTTRGCTSIVGPANLMCGVWMHHLDELDTIEDHIVSRWPDVRIEDRWMVTHCSKRMGHLLGPDGLRTGCVVPEFATLG